MSKAEELLKKDKSMSQEERQVKEIFDGVSAETRMKVLKSIKEYDSEEFDLSEVMGVLKYTFSLIERSEEEFEKLQKKQEELQQLKAEMAKKSGDSDDAVYLQQLESEIEAIRENMGILKDLTGLANRLVVQQERRERIEESRRRQNMIEITEHAAILEALAGAMRLALIQEGFSQKEREAVFQRYHQIQSRYPLVTQDMEELHKRLFGTPQEKAKIQDADFEVLDEDKMILKKIEGSLD